MNIPENPARKVPYIGLVALLTWSTVAWADVKARYTDVTTAASPDQE